MSGMRKVHRKTVLIHRITYFSVNQSIKISYQDVIVRDGDEEIPVIRECRSGSQVDELNYHQPTAMDAKVLFLSL